MQQHTLHLVDFIFYEFHYITTLPLKMSLHPHKTGLIDLFFDNLSIIFQFFNIKIQTKKGLKEWMKAPF